MRHFIVSEKAVQKADDPMKFCNSQCIQQRAEDILTSSTFSNADYDMGRIIFDCQSYFSKCTEAWDESKYDHCRIY